jgi:hypothetical protein
MRLCIFPIAILVLLNTASLSAQSSQNQTSKNFPVRLHGFLLGNFTARTGSERPTGRMAAASSGLMSACDWKLRGKAVALGKFKLGLGPGELQSLAFVTLVVGNQSTMYALRERRHLWRSQPSNWVLTSSVVDLAIVSTVALSGILTQPLRWQVLVVILIAATVFALLLDQLKLRVTSVWKFE